jgi:hypothetical protein
MRKIDKSYSLAVGSEMQVTQVCNIPVQAPGVYTRSNLTISIETVWVI